jgi:hypothetical protein
LTIRHRLSAVKTTALLDSAAERVISPVVPAYAGMTINGKLGFLMAGFVI